MEPLLKVTVNILAKLLNLCTIVVLCSWNGSEDKLTHLATICP